MSEVNGYYAILECNLVSRLKFIRQIQEFLPGQFSEEEEEIVNLLKQLTDYDFSAEIIRKIEQKYCKQMVLTFVHIDQL